MLVDLARAEAQKRADAGEDVVCAYLIGSVASGEPLLGGTADVDLVMVHEHAPTLPREMIPLSADVHHDVAHHVRAQYAQPRALRLHPWLGPAISDPVVLYDPQRFFEWVQAGTRGQFHRADQAVGRARAFLASARQAKSAWESESFTLRGYLQAALEGANAFACLAGPPAVGRRLALTLERQAHALGQPEVYAGFLRLLGAQSPLGWDVPGWLGACGRAFDDISSASPDPQLQPCRRAYHLNGFQALAEAGRPDAVLYPLLNLWQHLMRPLETYGLASPHRAAWQAALDTLNLGHSAQASRSQDLETYLDHIESLIDTWAERHGA